MAKTKGLTRFSTPQEEFWQGSFGDAYMVRNNTAEQIASDISLFSSVFKNIGKPPSNICELGAGTGNNLKAIRSLFPAVPMAAIEINKSACMSLRKIPHLEVINQSILNYSPKHKYDFVFTKGVLIHINPEKLPLVYKLLYQLSQKYILLAEYYNPFPTSVVYRGNTDRLFKRDFAQELLQKYPSLQLIDYGFVYHNDPAFPLDDISWFLLKK